MLANAVINRIKALFEVVGASAPAVATRIEAKQLAAAALLAMAALGDDHIDASERAALKRLLSARFGLDAAAVATLIEAAEREARDATQLLRFTRVVKDHFSPAERIELIEMIWEVVYADGELHAYEDSLLRRIAGLIYVSDRDRGAARKRVMARLRAAGQMPSPQTPSAD